MPQKYGTGLGADMKLFEGTLLDDHKYHFQNILGAWSHYAAKKESGVDLSTVEELNICHNDPWTSMLKTHFC